jgi:hypothetical protein
MRTPLARSTRSHGLIATTKNTKTVMTVDITRPAAPWPSGSTAFTSLAGAIAAPTIQPDISVPWKKTAAHCSPNSQLQPPPPVNNLKKSLAGITQNSPKASPVSRRGRSGARLWSAAHSAAFELERALPFTARMSVRLGVLILHTLGCYNEVSMFESALQDRRAPLISPVAGRAKQDSFCS